MVLLGLRLAAVALANRPVPTSRTTVRALRVPEPTRSAVVVVFGLRFAVALGTNCPVFALRETVRGLRAVTVSLPGTRG